MRDDGDVDSPPEAHVGILQTCHIYRVSLPIPHSLGPEVSARHAETNVCFKISSDSPPTTTTTTTAAATASRGAGEQAGSSCKFVSTVELQVKTTKEGDVAESLELFAAGAESSRMKVLLTAKVVKSSLDNPLLKEGVHLVSHQHGDEREWPGPCKMDTRVKFTSDTHLDSDPIHLVREDPNLPPVAYVGLLKHQHTYSIDIPVPHSMGPEISARHVETNACFTVSVSEVPVTVVAKEGEFMSTVEVQAKPLTEGDVREVISLFAGSGGDGVASMDVLVTAKIIKSTQGNPLLKDGVRVLSHPEGEREWPGPSREESHVRFASDTHLDPEPIRLTGPSDKTGGLPEVHVGILRNNYTYSIDLIVPHSLGAEISACHAQTNICFTVTEPPTTVERESDGGKYASTIKLQAKTVKNGDVAEKMTLFVGEEGNPSDAMTLLLTAKVIKSSQGNPYLKEGVHVISHQHRDDSDFTEWPGFSKGEEDEEKEMA